MKIIGEVKEQSESDYTGHIHYERLYRDLKYIFIRNEAIVIVVVTIEMIIGGSGGGSDDDDYDRGNDNNMLMMKRKRIW